MKLHKKFFIEFFSILMTIISNKTAQLLFVLQIKEYNPLYVVEKFHDAMNAIAPQFRRQTQTALSDLLLELNIHNQKEECFLSQLNDTTGWIGTIFE